MCRFSELRLEGVQLSVSSRCSRVSKVSSLIYIQAISLKEMGVFNAIVT